MAHRQTTCVVIYISHSSVNIISWWRSQHVVYIGHMTKLEWNRSHDKTWMEKVTWQNLNGTGHMTKLEWKRSHDKNGTGHMTKFKWNRSHEWNHMILDKYFIHMFNYLKCHMNNRKFTKMFEIFPVCIQMNTYFMFWQRISVSFS